MSESKNNPIDNMHVSERLSDYMDGLLPSDEREAVRAHLDECAECRADYVELRATQKLLQTVPAIVAPRSFTLTPEMAGKVRKASFWDRLFMPRNAPRLATGSVIAFVVLFLFMVGDFRMSNVINVPSPSIASSGVPAPEASTQHNSNAKTAAPTATTAAAAASGGQAYGGGSSAAAAPTETSGLSGPQTALPLAPTPAEPSAGSSADTARAPLVENTPVLTPNTEVGTGGTSDITTTTSDVAPAPPSSDGTTLYDQAPHVGPYTPTEGLAASPPSSDNNTGWVALQLSLLLVGLVLGIGAFIAWRST